MFTSAVSGFNVVADGSLRHPVFFSSKEILPALCGLGGTFTQNLGSDLKPTVLTCLSKDHTSLHHTPAGSHVPL